MISSASAQIEATGGDHLKTTIIKNGRRTVVPDYARVQGILIGTVAVYIILLTMIGPECVLLHGIHHRHFISDFDCRVI
jgi:MFS transporter, SHS family, lactate transporter